MRTIKFRAWDIKTKRIINLGGLPQIVDSECRDWDDFIIMQFTGLLDENGKEIYEGDIVSYKTFHYGVEKDRLRKVEWYTWTSDGYGQPDCTGYWNLDSSMEVIGNIYENPELINK